MIFHIKNEVGSNSIIITKNKKTQYEFIGSNIFEDIIKFFRASIISPIIYNPVSLIILDFDEKFDFNFSADTLACEFRVLQERNLLSKCPIFYLGKDKNINLDYFDDVCLKHQKKYIKFYQIFNFEISNEKKIEMLMDRIFPKYKPQVNIDVMLDIMKMPKYKLIKYIRECMVSGYKWENKYLISEKNILLLLNKEKFKDLKEFRYDGIIPFDIKYWYVEGIKSKYPIKYQWADFCDYCQKEVKCLNFYNGKNLNNFINSCSINNFCCENCNKKFKDARNS